MMEERINADFGQRAVVDTRTAPWVASPLPGVERRLLDRVGGEVARATSIVRYAPGSHFSAHTHERGEEFMVLDGVFSDEQGDYPAGSYVRNPPRSRHAPHSEGGCILFVKLRQFAPDDLLRVVVHTRDAVFDATGPDGVSRLPLHGHGTERVRLVRLEPGAHVARHLHPGGEEVLVLAGGYRDELGSYGVGSWVRSPPGSAHEVSSDSGALLYVKSGHLGVSVLDPPTAPSPR
jgi:anti-sigma factor ChrR (cupin superfamily)